MLIGIIFIIIGVTMILYGNSEYYQNYVEKHNFQDQEEILGDIRKMVAYIFITFGVLTIIYDIVLRIKG